MKYVQVSFSCIPNDEIVTDVLAAQLSEIGFESFVPSEKGMEAFVPQSLFSSQKIDEAIADFMLDAQIEYTANEVEDKNWNEEWEKNYFQPIVIDNQCIIHSSFHHPEGEYDYRILIDPKMAFGTGHHQTTGLILSEILEMDFEGKSVLDMGCGTAVLAILAYMRGANPVTAIDIDEWAYNNSLENIHLNKADAIDVKKGGAELLGKEKYDVIFANINRNILLEDMPRYQSVMDEDSILIMSGFYTEDVPAIRAKAEELGLFYLGFRQSDNWACVICSA